MVLFADFYQDFHSFIIGQVIGMFLIFMAVVMGARASYFREVIAKAEYDNLAILVSGCFSLLLGLLLISIHNHWVLEPDLIVTLFAWIVLIKSALWLTFPACMLNWTQKIYAGPSYYVMLVIMFIFGVLLLSRGLYPFSYGAEWNLPGL